VSLTADQAKLELNKLIDASISQRLTNFITSRMSSESTRPGISEINQDQIIAKLIYDNGVI